ncbi:hypothetical protein [Methanoculleus sp. 7T]|uniref:hypothetical protein n=1 Tax=Methanoculleus sp. 7T TaxID=2937282 RepID=UPI0020BF6652|nr:hypothetical protein [Methanoculleus sp. 7T]MCK8518544.1 hypothetical protein [Methanoculleus sp. 7T]
MTIRPEGDYPAVYDLNRRAFSREWGLSAPFPVPGEAFTVLELRQGSLEGFGGAVAYLSALGLCRGNPEE